FHLVPFRVASRTSMAPGDAGRSVRRRRHDDMAVNLPEPRYGRISCLCRRATSVIGCSTAMRPVGPSDRRLIRCRAGAMPVGAGRMGGRDGRKQTRRAAARRPTLTGLGERAHLLTPAVGLDTFIVKTGWPAAASSAATRHQHADLAGMIEAEELED